MSIGNDFNRVDLQITCYSIAYWGNRFATSTSNVVEIVRKKGLNLIISPRNDDMFLEQLNQALLSQSSQDNP